MCIRAQSIISLKSYIEDKDGKMLYKLLNDVLYGKRMESLRSRIDIKLGKNEKGYLKCTSKPSHMSQKIFDNNLIVIRVSLELNKPTYIGMYVFELGKVLMYEFHYDYIKNDI